MSSLSLSLGTTANAISITKTAVCTTRSSNKTFTTSIIPTKQPSVSLTSKKYYNHKLIVRASEAESITQVASVEKGGIEIIKNPSESKLTELGVKSWPKWGCPPSKFPWTYSAKETCYLLKGKVKVYPEGSDEAVEIGAGDLVVFPNGMSCTWDVSEEVDKHYKFD
ncbi:hypothetical protein Leryth_016564 [Lithospermum erythrorhizon]|nr:hypothetical protein Leryth_016564 [Lithospermum erythrorhizon]